jgi:solute carrier family 25 (mitochondrial folate transporter), member 32
MWCNASSADRRNVTVPELSSMEIFICSSISKMVATVITYPHEVVRTRLQIDYSPSSPSPSSSSSHPHPAPTASNSSPPHSSPESSTSTSTQTSTSGSSGTRKPHALSFGSMIDTTRVVLHENGWRGLYRGLSVNLLRTVPSSVITLVTCVQLLPSYFCIIVI